MKTKLSKSHGFTLIELLVAMAIIALLATISIFALQGARESARDGRRKSDLESIRQALEIYRADCGQYPASLPNPPNALNGSCPSAVTYMQKMPADPATTNSGYRYCVGGGNLTYTLYSTLENYTGTALSACGSCPGGSCYYSVSNP